MPKYIYEYDQWPDFTWDEKKIQSLLGKVRYMQGKILGRIGMLGFREQAETYLDNLSRDIVKSFEIEGEKLDLAQVRSSIARKLGLEYGGMVHPDRHIDGITEMMLDATRHYDRPLTEERLFGWHAAMFPSGYSGNYKIEVARYRTAPMQIVSGAFGKQKVHYVAPPPGRVKPEMNRFIEWFNTDQTMDDVIKSAVAHLRFVIIHPFDDGNGRIARALSDMLLARADDSPERFYSLSSQILKDRKNYYAVLQKVQHSASDVTDWLEWYLQTLYNALKETDKALDDMLFKIKFWEKHKETELNARQRLMLNKLLDGFTGKLKTSKWAKIAKCSQDTALRDITDLIEKGILKKENAGGRSTSYVLVRD